MLKKLDRSITLSGVIIISISGMLGSGIFVLPGIAYEMTGPSIWLAYLIAALGVLPAALSKSELATAMPTSGGTYIYIERTFGPLFGTIAGLGLWLSLLLKCAFSLVGFGAYFGVFTDVNIVYASLTLLGLITILNIFGVGKVAGTLFIIVSISIFSILGISTLGFFDLEPRNYEPFLTGGTTGLFATAATVFISYAGVTKIAAIAEEIKDPENNLPKGMMYSLLITTIVYCVGTAVLPGVLGNEGLSGNIKPFFTLGMMSGGKVIAMILSGVAILTMTSMANAGLLAASRFPFAMSRDNLLPSFLGNISKKFLTPVASIFISTVIIAAAILTTNVEKIAKVASVFMILMFIMVNVSVIILRETQVQWYKPHYKSPLYPFTQVFGIFCGVMLLWNIGDIVPKAIAAIVVPGLILFTLYSRKRTERKGVIGIRGKRVDLVEEQVMNVMEPHSIENFQTSGDARVVVALFGKERSAEMLIEMGIALADHGNLEVAHITEIPEQTDLNEIHDEPATLRSLRRRIIAMAVEKKEPITFDPVITHDIVKTIYDISQRFHCEWLAIEWIGKTTGSFTFHNPVGWLKSHLKCNLAVFRDTGVRYIRKIMVLIKHDDNDPLVIDTADHLAEVHKADLTFIKYVPTTSSEEYKEQEEVYLKELAKDCTSRCSFSVIESEDEISSIIAQTVEFDLLVFGGSEYKFINNFKATQDDRIMGKAACSVISVQTCLAQ